jgi:hypothetical protein
MTDIVEISARDLADLQRLANSGKVAEQVWNSPTHGMKLKALVKEAIPDANIPELDVLNQTNKVRDEAFAKVDEMAKELAAIKEENRKRDEQVAIDREESNFSKKLDAVRRAYNFTDEGMKKVTERMKEHNNPDVEAAAAWVRSQEPKVPTQSAYAPQTMDLYGSHSGDKKWEELNRNPVAFFDREVLEILNDPQYN